MILIPRTVAERHSFKTDDLEYDVTFNSWIVPEHDYRVSYLLLLGYECWNTDWNNVKWIVKRRTL